MSRVETHYVWSRLAATFAARRHDWTDIPLDIYLKLSTTLSFHCTAPDNSDGVIENWQKLSLFD